jgi:large subunit ribosomal protein L3
MELQGIIGKKLGMMQYYNEEGNVIPVTVIEAGPCYIIQKKDENNDGYTAVQLGFGNQKMQRVNKPLTGHFKKAGKGVFKHLKEFKVDNMDEVEIGAEVSVTDVFKVGEFVHVSGKSKGKGFAGVVKRYGFRGGRASHGSTVHRTPGAIGNSAYPGRVIKNKKLPGHMGSENLTIKNLQIIDIREDENLLIVKGPVPGHKNSIVYVKKQFFK